MHVNLDVIHGIVEHSKTPKNEPFQIHRINIFTLIGLDLSLLLGVENIDSVNLERFIFEVESYRTRLISNSSEEISSIDK